MLKRQFCSHVHSVLDGGMVQWAEKEESHSPLEIFSIFMLSGALETCNQKRMVDPEVSGLLACYYMGVHYLKCYAECSVVLA